jgi:hypothetical protein
MSRTARRVGLTRRKAGLGLQNVDLEAHGVHEVFVDVETVERA